MSYRSNVDEQVVKMSFDNSNFDSNVNDSIKTLNSLDSKLASLNNANFSGLNSGMESLSNFLTVKGQVMFGILTRLGNEVVNFGIKAKNALFGGIRDGLGEYNTIINSTQTIFQNVRQSGATIKDVKVALDKLNDYADLTIYNFGQMTNMIGKFTAAGVGLKKSVSTIKGLANAAALVGATPEKAEQAWQAVSRAMARGTFNLRTWYSLQTSSIASEQFVKVIKDVARANNAVGKSGENIDELLEKYGSIEYTLSENWLTSDLFNEAMSILSGDLKREQLEQKGYTEEQINELLDIAEAAEEAATQIKTFRQLMDTLAEAMGSGWSQSFRILIGDLDQAKVLYTRISNVISELVDNSARIRNELFKQIMGDSESESLFKGLKTGRESFRQTIENMMATVKTFLKAVKVGFLNIFPIERISTAARKVMDTIQNFTRAFVLNNEEAKQKIEGFTGWDTNTIDNISESVKDLIRFFRGLASAIDVVWQVVSQPIKAIVKRIPFFNNFFENLGDNVKGVVNTLGKFGDKITVFRNALKDTSVLENIVGYFIDNIDELGKRYPVLGAILWVFNAIKTAITGIKDAFKQLNIKPFAVIFGAIKAVVTTIWKVLNFIFELLKNIVSNIDWSILDGPKNAIVGFLKRLSDYGQGLISFEELVGNIGKKIKDIFSKIFSVFNKPASSNKFAEDGEKSFNKLGNTVTKVGNKIQNVWDKVKSFFSGIGTFFKNIFAGADWSLEGIIKKIALLGGGIATAALAISHLSKTIAKVRVLNNLNNLLSAGVNVLKAYQRQIQSKMIFNIAIAVGILVGALVGLAYVPYDKLENALIIISGLLTIMSVTLTPIISALTKLNDAISGLINPEATKYTVMETFIKKFKSVFNKLARGFEFRMIGKMFKDIAIGILILVGAMTALVFLFKYEGDNLVKSAKLIAMILAVMTASILSLIIAVEALSKKQSSSKASVGTFASFFKLSGVAKVIKSIAVAILILAGAMAIMTKLDPDRLKTSWGYVMWMLGLLGTIAVAIAAITSRAKQIGEFKSKVKVSLLGAMAGIALVLLSMKPLLDSLVNDNTGAWIKALIIFTAVIGQFTAMSIAIFEMAKRMAYQTTYLKRFNQSLIIMTVALGAIAGILYIISKMGDIPTSVVVTIGIISATLLGLISLIALVSIVLSKAQGAFSGNFANTILSISVAISSIIISIGVFAAGIGALVFALSNLGTQNSDIDDAFENIFYKLERIAAILNKAVPELKEMFYNIGYSIGRIFVSFISGIANGIVSTGEELLAIADKFVNLIIDLLDKVIDILYTRREDIVRIIQRAIEFIVSLITGVLNSFFKKSDGTGVFSEGFISKFLGISIAIAALGKLIISLGKVAKAVKSIKKSLIYMKIIKKDLDEISTKIVKTLANTKLVKGLGDNIANLLNKISKSNKFEFNPNAKTSMAELGAAALATYTAIVAVKSAFKGLAQLSGRELQNIRSDITDAGTAIEEFIFDSEVRSQSFVYGFAAVGNVIVTAIITLVKAIAIVLMGLVDAIWYTIKPLVTYFIQMPKKITSTYLEYLENSGLGASEAAEKLRGYLNAMEEIENFDKSLEAGMTTIGDSIVLDWTFEGGPWNVEGVFDRAQQNALEKQAKQEGENLSKNYSLGEIEGILQTNADVNHAFLDVITGQQDFIRSKWGIHSPSTVTRDMYKDIMMGAANGIRDGAKDLYHYSKNVSQIETELARNSAKAITEAWSDISMDPDFSVEKYKEYFKEMNSEEFALAFKGFGDSIEDFEDIVNNLDFSTYADALEQLTGKQAEAAWYNVTKALELSEYASELNNLNSEQLNYAMVGLAQSKGYDNQGPLRNLAFGIENANGGTTYLDLNEQLLNAVIAAKDEFEGLDSAQAKAKIEEIASGIEGLTNASYASIDICGALFSYVEEGATLTADTVAQLDADTLTTLQEIYGEERAAKELAIEDLMLGYYQMGQLAEENKDEIVGKKKEEVQEILEQQAIERGMSKKLAADTAALITNELFKGQSQRTDLTEQAYKNNIKIYNEQYGQYRQMEINMTNATKNFAEIRTKLYATQFHSISQMMQSGDMTPSELAEWMRDPLNKADYDNYTKLLRELSAAEIASKTTLSTTTDFVEGLIISDAPLTDVDKFLDSYYDIAEAAIKKDTSNKKKKFWDILSDFTSQLGIQAPELKLGYWDFTSLSSDSSELKDDISSAVSAASDLKDSLESQRADLTPTFDLDQLAEDAQKANGIVMSSLMAAQNASIGDYINQDSELNPFMKDRWQNVYNFTQNNYSPKALSRIDIYRQTQRQLSMSRGF